MQLLSLLEESVRSSHSSWFEPLNLDNVDSEFNNLLEVPLLIRGVDCFKF